MSFFYKGVALNGYRDVNGTTGSTSGSTWPMNSGIFLSSLAPDANNAYTTASPTSYGMLLQYGQSKQVTHTGDMTATVYHGRTYPSIEHGKYHFLTLQLSYRIPPRNMSYGLGGQGFGGTSQYFPGRGFDGSLGWMSLTHIFNSQLAVQQGTGIAVPPSVTQLQDIWGRRSSQATGAPLGLTGIIYNLQFEDLVNPSGWQQVTMTFSEVGIGFP